MKTESVDDLGAAGSESTVLSQEIVMTQAEFDALRQKLTNGLRDSMKSMFEAVGLPYDLKKFQELGSFDGEEVVTQFLVFAAGVTIGDEPEDPIEAPLPSNVVPFERKTIRKALASAFSSAGIRRVAIAMALITLVPVYSFADGNKDGFVTPADLPGIAARLGERASTLNEPVNRVLTVGGVKHALSLRRVSATEYEVVDILGPPPQIFASTVMATN